MPFIFHIYFGPDEALYPWTVVLDWKSASRKNLSVASRSPTAAQGANILAVRVSSRD